LDIVVSYFYKISRFQYTYINLIKK